MIKGWISRDEFAANHDPQRWTLDKTTWPINQLSPTETRRGAVSNSLHENIEAIESGYEFLLAYAAQGRETDEGPGGSEVRTTLTSMSGAAAAIMSSLENEGGFSAVIVDDARKSGAAISLVLAQEKISSELVDNLNVSIHLRALLTDLFLLSETTG
ncbi:MAG: hypothetical protein QGH93_12630 [Gammaproteobacteria bacterium]|jgi:hypothetical protein|nr:hypothetical protein [Gammaproteobacteria bacterium]